jgi:hypothetical protein
MKRARRMKERKESRTAVVRLAMSLRSKTWRGTLKTSFRKRLALRTTTRRKAKLSEGMRMTPTLSSRTRRTTQRASTGVSSQCKAEKTMKRSLTQTQWGSLLKSSRVTTAIDETKLEVER